MAITIGSNIQLNVGAAMAVDRDTDDWSVSLVRAWCCFSPGTTGGYFRAQGVSSVTYMAAGTFQISITTANRPDDSNFGFFGTVVENSGGTDAATLCWSSGSEQGVAVQTVVLEDADGAYKNYPRAQYVLLR